MKKLVIGSRLIESGVDLQLVLEEDEVETQLPRLGALGLEVIIEDGSGLRATGSGVDGVTAALEIRIVRLITYLSIREAGLEVVEPLVALDDREDVGPDARDTGRPVEEIVFELG